MSGLRQFKVTCPEMEARYFHTEEGAARFAGRILDREEWPDASHDYGYSDGVAVWRRDSDDRGWWWQVVSVDRWLRHIAEETA